MGSYKKYFGSSKYLRKEDIHPQGMLLTICAVREELVTSRGDEPKEKPVLYFEELEKGLATNKGHCQMLEGITGSDDMEKWIRIKIWIYVDPNVEYKQQKVGGIKLRPVTTGNGEIPKPADARLFSVPMSQPRAIELSPEVEQSL